MKEGNSKLKTFEKIILRTKIFIIIGIIGIVLCIIGLFYQENNWWAFSFLAVLLFCSIVSSIYRIKFSKKYMSELK
jgi:hypothetical membrane protein